MGATGCKCSHGGPLANTFHDVMREKYPMYVVRISDVLLMDTLEPHATLQKKGILRHFQDGMVVVFVSHQWIGWKVPDAWMDQFTELQNVLRGLINQAKKVVV